MVDPNEGTSLKFIPTQVINGVKCAKLTPDDVNSEIAYWQSSFLYSVLGANPPLGVIEGFLRRIWKPLDIDKISLMQNGLLFVCFNNLDDRRSVI